MKNLLAEFSDFIEVIIGVLAALLKGIKKRLGMRLIILQMLIGGVLAYGTIGFIDIFFADTNQRMVIIIAFSVGWVASEFLDYLDDAVKEISGTLIDSISQWINNVFGSNKNDKDDEKD